MRAIVLVGGEGTRLRPLTYSVPKQMLPVVEVPLIERVVAHLVSHGVTDVILSLGYKPDAFVAAYPSGSCAGASLTYVVEPTLMDTAGAVLYAATEAGIDARFLVFNGDVLTDLDIGALIAFHDERGAEGTIALTPVEDPSAFGVVPTAEDGTVEAFIEKPAPGTAPTNMINAGTYVLERSVLDRIPAGRRVNIERETFPAMVADGVLYGLGANGYWLDVGTPDRYLAATADLLSGRRPGPPAPGAVDAGGHWEQTGARVDGDAPGSLVATGATVFDGAVAKRSVVGAGAHVYGSVTDSVVMAGAVVEQGARVAGSIVGPDAVVGRDAVVDGGTIVGPGFAVPPGSRHTAERLPTG